MSLFFLHSQYPRLENGSLPMKSVEAKCILEGAQCNAGAPAQRCIALSYTSRFNGIKEGVMGTNIESLQDGVDPTTLVYGSQDSITRVDLMRSIGAHANMYPYKMPTWMKEEASVHGTKFESCVLQRLMFCHTYTYIL